MTKFYVYILYSPKYDNYYIGQTNALARRLEEHNTSDLGSYTKKYRPWDLHFSMAVSTRSVGVRIEKYLKKKPRDYINRLASDLELQDYIKDRFEV